MPLTGQKLRSVGGPGTACPVCISMTHKRVDLDTLEKLFVKDPVSYAERIRLITGCREALVLQTCNRFEIYLDEASEEQVSRILEDLGSKLTPLEARAIDVYRGVDAVRHLFRVASGLESMIVGETQILGQVEEAYTSHSARGLTGRRLRLLFERAIRTGKRARSETGISRGAVSIASAAVELLHDLLKSVEDKNFLVVGAGSMAGELVAILSRMKIGSLTIANRTVERAEALARRHGCKWAPLTELRRLLREADVVLSAVSVDKPIITYDMVEEAASPRRDRHLFIVDISTPRSVDPEASKVKMVVLKDIDDLRQIARRNLLRRLGEIPKVESMIEEEIARYLEMYSSRAVEEAVARIYAHAEEVRRRELERALRKLGGDGVDPKVLEDMSRSILKKALHPIISGIRRAAREDGSQAYLMLLKMLEEVDGR